MVLLNEDSNSNSVMDDGMKWKTYKDIRRITAVA